MATIGIWIETENGSVKPANFGVVTAARGGGGHTLVALLLDGEAEAARAALAPYGVQRIVPLSAAGADPGRSPEVRAEMLAAAVETLGLKALLGLATATGRDLFARLAARLGLPLASDCLAVDLAGRTVRKSHFSGRTVATIRIDAPVLLAALRPNAVEPAAAPGAAPEIAPLRVAVTAPGRVRVLEVKAASEGRIDLAEANVIVTGGRPIGAAENFRILEACARELGGAVGASRAAVDAGFAPHAMQVGQTGKTVSPRLYIGCGLSGSVQHFAGMKTAKVIVGINTDKDAPIFEKCDYGIVGDLFEVVPALTEALRQGK
jgi:electron transfer flavoprotein alpha subunit